MPEDDKGFTVTDRRLFQPDEQGQLREEESQTVAADSGRQAASQSAANPQADDSLGKKAKDAAPPRNLPPVEFGSFIISLAHAAMMHLGHLDDPHGNPVERNLDLARHTVDTVAMLKDKTKGNLSGEEQSLLDGILSELRMLYVQARKNL